ncbi:MAG: type ISP restriction/modification enzyme [Rubrobacter sp.]
MLEEVGLVMSLGTIITKTEAPVEDVGRPDLAVDINGLLGGYVELKAPGAGARADRFKERRNKEQWKKFAALPNLIYTDGNEWVLFRSGKLTGKPVRFSGDVTTDGAGAATQQDADALAVLFRDFLSWDPIVPTNPQRLAEMLAPLCHLVRDDVLDALGDPHSNLSALKRDWQAYLFPDADDAQFADAYAQTLTYALLLARFDGQTDLSADSAAATLQRGHGLLAQVLRLLADPQARAEISVGVSLLERSVAAVDPAAVTRKNADPWLYFYEDFLAAYDKQLRNDRGVYYTPVEVVQAQVNLVSDLLVNRLKKKFSFADEGVVVLDPAAGTGTYPLVALQHGLDLAAARYGQGMTGEYATRMAGNFHAFELLVGPYTVAHLRLTERIREAGGLLPGDGAHVYLTDTLESPHAAPPTQAPLFVKQLTEEHERARKVKETTDVLVCIGNPPYNRHDADDPNGGWVRRGDDEHERPLVEDFFEPARETGAGGHLKNLYNDYVYFWRWALWKVFDTKVGPGIVSFITASSYLRGPGFVGMRETMRRTFDELWIIDLEGGLGPRPTPNVFAIRTPVAIAVGIRHGDSNLDKPADVHYAKIEGSRDTKLRLLSSIKRFDDLEWRDCFSGWQNPFLPEDEGDYFSWPLLTDLFPWQHSGVQMKRTWPIGETSELLETRWDALLSAPDQRAAFRDTDSKIDKSHPKLDGSGRLDALSMLRAGEPAPERAGYAFRAFDRQYILKDPRLGDRMRPELWRAHSNKQAYMTSLLTGVLGLGPSAIATSEVPDLHHFRGSYGGKDAIPLWRDAAATKPNVAGGLLDTLSEAYAETVSPEDLFGYAYALLSTPAYVESFSEELTLPGPRLPVTRDAELFREVAELGRRMIHLHTFGERFDGEGVPDGQAKNTKAIPGTPNEYPEDHAYDASTKTLRVGGGEISPVEPEVWEFSVSGLRVVKSWLDYRKRQPSGKSSSPLDEIRPERWTGNMTQKLLELLWVLEATVEEQPGQADILDRVVQSDLFDAAELPPPSEEERKPPKG